MQGFTWLAKTCQQTILNTKFRKLKMSTILKIVTKLLNILIDTEDLLKIRSFDPSHMAGNRRGQPGNAPCDKDQKYIQMTDKSTIAR
jgi:hypothetical protein